MNQQPIVFRDGRKDKVWICHNGDIDGPFDSETDAQPTVERLSAATPVSNSESQ